MCNLNEQHKYSEITEEICYKYLFGYASLGAQTSLS